MEPEDFGRIVNEKLKDTEGLYQKLLEKDNQIQKEMKSRIEADRIEEPQYVKEEIHEEEDSSEEHESEDDLEQYAKPLNSSKFVPHILSLKPKLEEKPQKQEESK